MSSNGDKDDDADSFHPPLSVNLHTLVCADEDKSGQLEVQNVGVESASPRNPIDYSMDFHNNHQWTDRDSMIAWARGVGRSRNMVLTISNSWPRKVVLACEKYGSYKSGKKGVPKNETRSRRKTITKRSNCKFELHGREVEKNKWLLSVVCGIHNHDLPQSLDGHAYPGRLTKEEYERVKCLSANLVKPKEILAILKKENPNNVTSRKQIYNYLSQMKKEDTGDMNTLEGVGVEDDGEEDVVANVTDVQFQAMIKKYESGQMHPEQAYRIVSIFNETDNSSSSTSKESQIVVAKGKEKKNLCKRDLSSREISQEYDTLHNKSKGKKSSYVSLRCDRSGQGPEVSTNNVSMTKTRPGEEEPHDIIYLGFNWGFHKVDDFMLGFITKVIDVALDGHCGYRVLAELMGWGQHEYKRVRWELVAELKRNEHIYAGAMQATSSIGELIFNVNYTGSCCTSEHWLKMPMVGLAFATLYQVALVMLSWSAPMTCLPMMATSPNASPPTKVLAMALAGNNSHHFVPVCMVDGAPIPPPTDVWQKYRDSSVAGWDLPFSRRIDEFCRYRIREGRPCIF